MDVNAVAVLGSFLALMVLAPSTALPAGNSLNNNALSAAKRPKYMDTRDEFDVLKDTVYVAIRELVQEGRLSSAILDGAKKPMDKRAYMGICMKRTQNNEFFPVPCIRDYK
ncbi:uncharacterized protein LOC121381981 [Gigantopelta aegis]|uniref:uncharacterized protein LOC121381981 n=1 Tax=Gigantopelta aegis TaxID=1735272 RepID=UPI001B88CE74|nr:uncharacterized protein LOC121381981 [Gigantopelta aegis]